MAIKTLYWAFIVALGVVVFTAIHMALRSEPQKVTFENPQTYSTQYRECQEVKGQYVKDTLNLQVDKILAGCVD